MKKDYKSHILAVTSESANRAVINDNMFTRRFTQQLPFESNDIFIGPRNILEYDTNFKHIIPYILIEQNGKYLSYQRTTKSGESRLHGSYSIGFGGHIDVGDIVTQNSNQEIDLLNTVYKSAAREITEELSLQESDVITTNFEIYGFLTDNSNEVGLVHFGLVLKLVLKSDIIVVSPENQIDLKGFKTIDELYHTVSDYENWSSALIKHLKNDVYLEI